MRQKNARRAELKRYPTHHAPSLINPLSSNLPHLHPTPPPTTTTTTTDKHTSLLRPIQPLEQAFGLVISSLWSPAGWRLRSQVGSAQGWRCLQLRQVNISLNYPSAPLRQMY